MTDDIITRPSCIDCGDELRASYDGRCWDCHDRRLPPLGEPGESWSDVYLGGEVDW